MRTGRVMKSAERRGAKPFCVDTIMLVLYHEFGPC